MGLDTKEAARPDHTPRLSAPTSSSPSREDQIALKMVSKLTTLVSTILIGHYDPTTAHEIQTCRLISLASITNVLSNPSPAIFITACFAFVLATCTFIKLHREDRYQARFIAGGAIVALISIATFGGENKYMDLKGILPQGIFCGMATSSMFHDLTAIRNLRHPKEEEETSKEKIGDDCC